jgi:hypothetical protein
VSSRTYLVRWPTAPAPIPECVLEDAGVAQAPAPGHPRVELPLACHFRLAEEEGAQTGLPDADLGTAPLGRLSDPRAGLGEVADVALVEVEDGVHSAIIAPIMRD